MHAEKDDKRTLEHAEKSALVERARELLKGVNLTDAAELEQARALLLQQEIPQWTLFALVEPRPVTEAGLHWAEQRLAELKASGDVS